MPTLKQDTQRHKKEFLENYREGRYICAAARKTGVNPATVWDWRQDDEKFRLAFEAMRIKVEQMIVAKLEAEADRRAMQGVTRGIFFKGLRVADEKEYSDTLLIFRLKGLAPEKYHDRHEVGGLGGGPIPIAIEWVKWDGSKNEAGHATE